MSMVDGRLHCDFCNRVSEKYCGTCLKDICNKCIDSHIKIHLPIPPRICDTGTGRGGAYSKVQSLYLLKSFIVLLEDMRNNGIKKISTLDCSKRLNKILNALNDEISDILEPKKDHE